MNEKVAFFDVDHTLIRRSSCACFLLEARKQGLIRRRWLLAIPFYYFKYIFQNISWDSWKAPIPCVAGVPREVLTRIAQDSWERRFRASVFPGMVSRVTSLKDAGVPVWIASSSVDFLVAPLADALNSDGIVASELEFRDGKSTGYFGGVPAFGKEKLRRVRALAERLAVDLADCSFYSDSIHDLPLLEAVGKPVAVNPDFRLSRIAKARGWEIVRGPGLDPDRARSRLSGAAARTSFARK